MYFLRNLLKKSLKEISVSFKKEHSTIIYNHKTLEKKLQKDFSLKIKVDYLLKEVSKELSDTFSDVEYNKINESDTSF